jgi:hypothetical protein
MSSNVNENPENNWGYHLNRTKYSQSYPPVPEWANSFQEKNWTNEGLVLWDARIYCITHLRPTYAYGLLIRMKEKSFWKTEGIIVGSPTYEITLEVEKQRKKKDPKADQEKPKGKWVLSDQIKLAPNQAQELFDFLLAEENTLQELALVEKKEAREALAGAYEILIKARQKRRNADANSEQENSVGNKPPAELHG